MAFLLYLVKVKVEILTAANSRLRIEIVKMSALIGAEEPINSLKLLDLVKFNRMFFLIKYYHNSLFLVKQN